MNGAIWIWLTIVLLFCDVSVGIAKSPPVVDTANPEFVVLPTDKVVGVGRNVTLPCQVTGNPPPAVFWSRGTAQSGLGSQLMFPKQDHGRFVVGEDGTLRIENIQLMDAGVYQCQALNVVGSAVATAKIDVRDVSVGIAKSPPVVDTANPEFVVLPTDKVVGVGRNVTLPCQVTGNPPPAVFWSRGTAQSGLGPQLMFPKQDHGRFVVGEDGTLRIENIQLMDAGVYQCQALNVVGSAVATAKIDVRAPSSPPRNVRTRRVGSSSMVITWEEPRIPNGVIKGYKVFYTLMPDLPIVLWENREVGNDAKRTTLTDLKVDSTYTLSVLAFTEFGEGPMSDSISVKTSQCVISASSQPRNLYGEVNSPNSMRLSWEAPTESHTIESYVLYYHDFHFRQNLRVSITSLKTAFTLKDLTPDTVYNIQVSAKCQREGAKSSAIQLRTWPFVPGKPTRVRLEAINSTTVYVQWQSPTRKDRNGIIRGYQVQYVPVDENDQVTATPWIVDITDEGVTATMVTNLNADTIYWFHVVAYTRKGDGIRSKTKTVRTKEPVLLPTSPRNLNVELIDEKQLPRVRLTWQPPRETHGDVEGYKVVWGKHGETNKERILPGERYTFDTELLKKGVIYEFNVSAKNAVDFGQIAVVTVRIPDGVPRGAPQNISAIGLSETSVRLAWDPPAENLRNGKIIMYQIAYHKLGDSISLEHLYRTEMSVEIAALELDTDYVFQMKAFTTRGAGPWSNQLHFRAIGQIPPAPMNVKIQLATPTSLLVFWDEPLFPVAGYKVYFSLFAPPDMNMWQNLEIGPYIVAEITHLRPHSIYAVRVKARALDGRYGNISTIALGTISADVPTPPRNLNVELLAEEQPRVSLTWQRPLETHGVIEGYKVVWGKQGGSYGEEMLSSEKYNFMTDLLEKGVTYEFRVSAKNAVDFGQIAVETLTIPDGLPQGAPQNFSVIGLSATRLRLVWDLPAKDLRNGKIAMYQITYHTIADPMDVENLNITEMSVDIVALAMYTDYVFQIKAFTSQGAGPWGNQLHFRTVGQNNCTCF